MPRDISLNADFYLPAGSKLEAGNVECFSNPSLHESLLFLETYQMTKVCPKGDTSGSELKMAKSAFTLGSSCPLSTYPGPKRRSELSLSPRSLGGAGPRDPLSPLPSPGGAAWNLAEHHARTIRKERLS